MLEIGFVVVVIAGAAVMIGRFRSGAGYDDLLEEDYVDLPCPWCQAPTREDDTTCPSCAHPFGRVTSP